MNLHCWKSHPKVNENFRKLPVNKNVVARSYLYERRKLFFYIGERYCMSKEINFYLFEILYRTAIYDRIRELQGTF